MRQLPLTGEETSGAEALIPERPSLKSLREAAARCTACDLHKTATQTVSDAFRKLTATGTEELAA